ncbi:hypothetical protein HRG_014346 [Hirsutella rhossiliensis]
MPRLLRHFGMISKIKATSSNAANMRKDIAEATQRDHPEVLINDRDVGYIQRQLRLQRYGATTSTQAFLDVLLAAKADGEVAFFAVDRGPNGKIWRIFWIYSDCLADWKRNPELLIMDNTYLVKFESFLRFVSHQLEESDGPFPRVESFWELL